MYDYIRGKLTEINPAFAVIETGGIGYVLNISLNTYTKLAGIENVRLYTHLVVREDAHVLFGFADLEERELFRLLISVSGIGPNTARLLLSSLTFQEIKQAIATANVGLLKSVKGIGEKSAQRIIVDLRDKLDKGVETLQKVDLSHNTIREESLSGLIILGFPKKLAEKAIDEVIKGFRTGPGAASQEGGLNVETLIKEALKRL
jgi:Holliday junction DNA helicase RuvA